MANDNQAVASLRRIQDFDPNDLARTEELGRLLSFTEAVVPAAKLVAFFRQIPWERLDELPDRAQLSIKEHADGTYNIFSDIMHYNPKNNNHSTYIDTILKQLRDRYESAFHNLVATVSYLSYRSVDISQIAQQARSTTQAAIDEVERQKLKIQSSADESVKMLDEMRKVAAEQGVSQQAHYFSDAAMHHGKESKKWNNYTIFTAILLFTITLVLLFIHKVRYLEPKSTYEATQLAISKVLLFGIVAYLLVLCARTLVAHRHNEIVNRHRQNALLTFNALANAAIAPERRDQVLGYAASCIYTPQETGFTKPSSAPPMPASQFVEALPRIISSSSSGAGS